MAREGALDVMTSLWLPFWLGSAGSAAFGGILIVHFWHIIVLTGRERLWHCVHVLMAAGMIVMFAPTGGMVVSGMVGMVVFAAAAVITACLLVRERLSHRNVGGLWLAAVIDLAAMAYMFAMTSTRLVWLTLPLVGWCLLQAAGWGSGRFYAVLARGGLGGSRPALAPVPQRTPVSAAPVLTVAGVARDQPPDTSGHSHQDDAAHRAVIRATLAVMSLGMAGMLIVMQFGMATMPGMQSM
jgi:hypothetical protein